MLIIFFFNDTSPTEIYTLSLHDALPISKPRCCKSCIEPDRSDAKVPVMIRPQLVMIRPVLTSARSEEHTSELQSRENLVCRLLLEKKKVRSDFESICRRN